MPWNYTDKLKISPKTGSYTELVQWLSAKNVTASLYKSRLIPGKLPQFPIRKEYTSNTGEVNKKRSIKLEKDEINQVWPSKLLF